MEMLYFWFATDRPLGPLVVLSSNLSWRSWCATSTLAASRGPEGPQGISWPQEQRYSGGGDESILAETVRTGKLYEEGC
jgi:hypothetical protein